MTSHFLSPTRFNSRDMLENSEHSGNGYFFGKLPRCSPSSPFAAPSKLILFITPFAYFVRERWQRRRDDQ